MHELGVVVSVHIKQPQTATFQAICKCGFHLGKIRLKKSRIHRLKVLNPSIAPGGHCPECSALIFYTSEMNFNELFGFAVNCAPNEVKRLKKAGIYWTLCDGSREIESLFYRGLEKYGNSFTIFCDANSARIIDKNKYSVV